MDTKRISKSIEEILNQQVKKEAEAAQTFLAYAVWAGNLGYSGTADLLFRHSGEERDHMMKVIQYIQTRGGHTKISALSAPPKDPKNLEDCFEKLFKYEVENTTAIYGVVNLSQEEKDWATWNFMQWFVKEQVEEETMMMNILDQLKIAGGHNASDESLLLFDSKLKNHSGDAE